MDHLAIMKKSWGLIPKILRGEKTIESRWYTRKYAPWDKITEGDSVYFKNAGEPVIAKAEVSKVLQYSDLVPKGVEEILYRFGELDGLGLESIPEFIELFKNKKYCILVFLKNTQQIEPFKINKSGFGIGAAWLIVEDINQLKKGG